MRFAGAALACLFAFSAVVSAESESRADAVFVLGADDQSANAFFSAAATYYATRLRRDDLLVTTARTWSEVRELLARSPQRGARPWGRVVIVAHGSQWTGLAVPVFAAEKPPRGSQIASLLASQAFPPLPLDVLDDESNLVFESCGIGRRADLLAMYARLLAGDAAGDLQVVASEGLVEFSVSVVDGRRRATRAERTYEFDVRRSARLMPRSAAARISEQHVDGFDAPPSWSSLPVNLVMRVDKRSCRVRPASRLTRVGAVKTALRDYGLEPAQLQWSLQPVPGGSCDLIGQAEILTSRPPTIARVQM